MKTWHERRSVINTTVAINQTGARPSVVYKSNLWPGDVVGP